LISATLKNGNLVSGLLVKETEEDLTLRLPATPITNTVKKADIVSRTKPATAMPVMTSLLTRMEVRDLVAYLSTLKSAIRAPKERGHSCPPSLTMLAGSGQECRGSLINARRCRPDNARLRALTRSLDPQQ